MVKLLETVTGSPENAGIFARLKTLATHPPTEVPPNGSPVTLAVVTRPLGAKVITARPEPQGPSGRLQTVA